jgi:hypothetical protein
MKDLYGKEIPQSVMDAYEVELNEFIKKMNACKPDPLDYNDPANYKQDLSEWDKAYSMDMPNKPGYYRANND